MDFDSLRSIRPWCVLSGDAEHATPLLRCSRYLTLVFLGSVLMIGSYSVANTTIGWPRDYEAGISEFNAKSVLLSESGRLPSVSLRSISDGLSYRVVAVIDGEEEGATACRVRSEPRVYCLLRVDRLFLDAFPLVAIDVAVELNAFLIAATISAAEGLGDRKGVGEKDGQLFAQRIGQEIFHAFAVRDGESLLGVEAARTIHGPIQYITVTVFWMLVVFLFSRWKTHVAPDRKIRAITDFGSWLESEERGESTPWSREYGNPQEMFELYDRASEITKVVTQCAGASACSSFLTLRKAGHAAFQVMGNVSLVPSFVEAKANALADRAYADTGIVRYLIWAIPTIGFVGTVVGIGRALQRTADLQSPEMISQAIARAAISMEIGVAFDTTLVALVLSLFGMLLYHAQQQAEESAIHRQRDEAMDDIVRPENAGPDGGLAVPEITIKSRASKVIRRSVGLGLFLLVTYFAFRMGWVGFVFESIWGLVGLD